MSEPAMPCHTRNALGGVTLAAMASNHQPPVRPAPQRAVLYFDVISPFVYLLDAALRRDPLPLAIERRPVLFAALLDAHGQKGPAEIAAKRAFTYRHCAWTARSLGIAFRMPAVHPFNPLRYLRLIIALGSTATVVSTVVDALFTTGDDPDDPATFERLALRLGLSDPQSGAAPAVKQALRENTDAAIAAGVFGVPTLLINDQLFWGMDSLPMVREWLAGGGAWPSPDIAAAGEVPIGTVRPAVR